MNTPREHTALYVSELTVQHPSATLAPELYFYYHLSQPLRFHNTQPFMAHNTPLSEKNDTAVALYQRLSTL